MLEPQDPPGAMFRRARAPISALLSIAMGTSLNAGNVLADSAPPAAAQVGYTSNTFSSDFVSSDLTASIVDKKNTKNRGFKWYLWNLFSAQADPDNVVLNSDGTVTLLGTPAQNGQIVTAVTYTGTNSFAGTAFGGGAYFEAEMKFDPKTVEANGGVDNWPAFWALQIEGNVTGSAQWPGQSSQYIHSVEADFFEAGHYNPLPLESGYGGSLHDWYGVRNKTCGSGLCQAKMTFGDAFRVVPTGTNFNQFHRYGFLWVPATSSSAGYAKFYFDGQQLGPAQQWTLYANQAPPAEGQPWAFGIIDQRHLFLILGTGKGQPLTIRSVNAWQKGAGSNWSY